MKETTSVLLLLALSIGLSTVIIADEEPVTVPVTANPRLLMKTSMGDITIELLRDAAPKTAENFLGLALGTKEWKDPATGEMVKRPFYDGLGFHRIIPGFMIQGGCPLGNGMGDPGYKFDDEVSAKALGLDRIKVLENDQPVPSVLQILGIRDQQAFQRMVVQPLFRSLGITSQADLDARKKEVQKALAALTLEDALVNLGYRYDDSLKSVGNLPGTLSMANAGPNTNGSQFFINLVDNKFLNGKHTVFGKVVAGMDVVERIAAVRTANTKPVEPVTIVSIRAVATDTPGAE